MNCPFCGHANIEGAELCDECHQPLTDQHLPTPSTEVERALLSDRVQILTPKPPITVSPETPVGAVLNTLVEHGIGCVLVMDDQNLVGIFTERDALLKLGEQAQALADEPVSRFMTTSPQTLVPTAKVAFAVQRMDLGGYRHVPVVNEAGGPEGMISVRDILTYLTDRMQNSGS